MKKDGPGDSVCCGLSWFAHKRRQKVCRMARILPHMYLRKHLPNSVPQALDERNSDHLGMLFLTA